MYNKIKEFLQSLRYFIELYRGGFRIHRSPTVMQCNFYRFYWFDDVMKDMADIDFVTSISGYRFWNTLKNGHVERLGLKVHSFYNKEYHYTNNDASHYTEDDRT